ncbi:MAG: hypothetical protein UHD09_03170 [Bifidobacterium sp.]|nr:hypothetical protein [Bifidobacterium sp.]
MPTVTGIAPGASGVIAPTSPNAQHPRHDRTRQGHLRVAAVFSDHMVLQRDRPIAVFGYAPKNGHVVSIGDGTGRVLAESVARANCGIPGIEPGDGAECAWIATLPALPAGGPYVMVVSCGTSTITFRDVLLGEVWFAGGQSNMELELHTSAGGAHAIDGAHDARLRFINIPKVGQVDEAAESESSWAPATAPQVAHMSAVAYWFGRRLRERLDGDVPVGIIDCYIGGTSITCWMGRETLRKSKGGRPTSTSTSAPSPASPSSSSDARRTTGSAPSTSGTRTSSACAATTRASRSRRSMRRSAAARGRRRSRRSPSVA